MGQKNKRNVRREKNKEEDDGEYIEALSILFCQLSAKEEKVLEDLSKLSTSVAAWQTCLTRT